MSIIPSLAIRFKRSHFNKRTIYCSAESECNNHKKKNLHELCVCAGVRLINEIIVAMDYLEFANRFLSNFIS